MLPRRCLPEPDNESTRIHILTCYHRSVSMYMVINYDLYNGPGEGESAAAACDGSTASGGHGVAGNGKSAASTLRPRNASCQPLPYPSATVFAGHGAAAMVIRRLGTAPPRWLQRSPQLKLDTVSEVRQSVMRLSDAFMVVVPVLKP